MSTVTTTGVAHTKTRALISRTRTALLTFKRSIAISVLRPTVRATQANVKASERTMTWWKRGSVRIAW